MEFIELSGYALEEKVHIAQKHLIPKQQALHGLTPEQCSLGKPTIKALIQDYTSESGVRSLERCIASLCRKVTKALVSQETLHPKIQPTALHGLLGLAPYTTELYQKIPIPGVSIGLAWTPVGGDILFIESTLIPGEGKLQISGQLGEVMEESATAATSYLKAHAQELHIDPRLFRSYDLHIHVPDGATPKDGPSAGITIYTAIASLYTHRKVRAKLAMTGELTLRGTILPVGGIKEKVLAAKRAGIKTLILSTQNEKDIRDISPDYLRGLTFHYLEHVDALLPLALHKQPVSNPPQWPIEEGDTDKRP